LSGEQTRQNSRYFISLKSPGSRKERGTLLEDDEKTRVSASVLREDVELWTREKEKGGLKSNGQGKKKHYVQKEITGQR